MRSRGIEGPVRKRIAAFRSTRHLAVNAEPLDVDVDAEQRLDATDDQEGDVVSASPEAPAKSRNYRGRQEGQPGKAAEVVAVCDVASADRTRGEVVAQEAGNEE